jgi:hypothetical protein
MYRMCMYASIYIYKYIYVHDFNILSSKRVHLRDYGGAALSLSRWGLHLND